MTKIVFQLSCQKQGQLRQWRRHKTPICSNKTHSLVIRINIGLGLTLEALDLFAIIDLTQIWLWNGGGDRSDLHSLTTRAAPPSAWSSLDIPIGPMSNCYACVRPHSVARRRLAARLARSA